MCIMLPQAVNVHHFDATQWSLLGFMGVICLFVTVFMWTLKDGPDYREAYNHEFNLRYECMVDTARTMRDMGYDEAAIEPELTKLIEPSTEVHRMCLWSAPIEEHTLEITQEMVDEFDAKMAEEDWRE